MVLKIISQNKVPEMKRTHISAELIFEKATPSSNDVKAELAKGLKADPETIVINKIDTHFGESKASVDAFQYDSKEALDAVSRKLPKKQKEKIDAQNKKKEDAAKAAAEPKAEEPKAAEEKPAEKPAEEKPAEEPKAEEKTAEEKPEEQVAEQPKDKADASVSKEKSPKEEQKAEVGENKEKPKESESEEKSESKEKPKEESKEKSE